MPWMYATVEHEHCYKGAPVTIVVCNDTFHRNANSLPTATMLVAELRHEGPDPQPGTCTDAEAELLRYIRSLHTAMVTMGHTPADRLTVWESLGKATEFDSLVNKAFS